MNVAVIFNPVAGRGLAARRLEAVLRSFRGEGVEPAVLITRRHGDARTMALESAARSDVVVAFGGDGTVHEVASGLYSAREKAAMAVIPAGSGNDFAKMFDLPSDIRNVAKLILNGSDVPVDIGAVTVVDRDGRVSEGVFVNAFGIGFDSVVADRASRSRKIRGTMGYLSVALATLGVWRSINMTVSCDGWDREGDTLLITLGNGRCSGGGFYLTPKASLTDGLLDLCCIEGMGLPRMLLLLPRVLWGGHLGSGAVTYLKTGRASIEADVAVPVHLDGEILSRNASKVEIKLLPAAINVRARLR